MFKKKERNDGEYDKRSDRLNAWSNLIRSFSKLLWIFVIFIIIAGLGKLFIFKSGKNVPSRTIIEKPVLKRIPWESVNLEIKEVLQVYAIRMKDLQKRKNINYVQIFKNNGGEAGTSIIHTHTQIVATTIIPRLVQEKIEALKEYEKCPYCDIIKEEDHQFF